MKSEPWAKSQVGVGIGGQEPHRPDERGSGTLLSLAVGFVLVFTMTAVAGLAGAAQTRWAAQSGADLAALAAAQDLIYGKPLPAACARGGEVARANGAQVVSCLPLPGGRVAVTTQRETPAWLWGIGRATAVAGPPVIDRPLTQVTGSTDAAAQAALDWANQQIGLPYVWGGTGPDGFDCSGLVQQAYRHGAGVTLPRVAQDQYNAAIKVPFGQMRPGDLIFWVDQSGVHHVALNAGQGLMVEAPSTGKSIRQVPIRWAGTTPWAGRF